MHGIVFLNYMAVPVQLEFEIVDLLVMDADPKNIDELHKDLLVGKNSGILQYDRKNWRQDIFSWDDYTSYTSYVYDVLDFLESNAIVRLLALFRKILLRPKGEETCSPVFNTKEHIFKPYSNKGWNTL